jgi:hypothetical protein
MAHGTHHGLASIIGSVALGAVAMYAFDPDKGRRRRALARDKAYSLMLDTRHAAGATKRDVAHRLDGLQARARRLWTTRPTADDLQLIERVRARMGRMVSHPHALRSAHCGRHRRGPVLAHEKASLLAAVCTVWACTALRPARRPRSSESIPSLQGGSDHCRASARALAAGAGVTALSGGVLIALLAAAVGVALRWRRRDRVGIARRKQPIACVTARTPVTLRADVARRYRGRVFAG